MQNEKSAMMYKQIIFDVDGTLIDTEYALLHSLQETIETATGRIIELNDLTFALGITGKDALVKLEIADVPSVLALWDENLKKLSDTVNIFDGISDLLDALVRAGYKSGIVTSKTRAEFEHEFYRFNISGHFATVVCADDTAAHKPSPEPLLKYMEISNMQSHELLYVGDSIYDMECAKSAGIDFALACWGASSRDIAAKYYLEKPFDLIAAITR